LVIKNKGSGLPHASVPNTLAAPFQVSTGAGANQPISPKQSLTVNLTFNPTSAGKYQQTLTITSDDPKHASVTIEVSGTAK
jgi:hypothetical protein